MRAATKDASTGAAAGRLAGEALHLLGRHEDQPRVPRVVAVRRVEGGPARAEGSVEPELDGPHGKPPVSDRLDRGALAILAPGFLPAQGREHAKGKMPAADEPRIRRQRGQIEAGLMGAREAFGEAFGDDDSHRLVEALLGRRRNERADELLRHVDQEPGGLAAIVPRDAAARGIARVTCDIGTGEGGAARPRRMAVHAHERDGVPGRRAVDRCTGREALPRPACLIPAPSGDPLAGPPSGRGGPDHGGNLLFGVGRTEVELEPRLREQHQMAVPVDEAGEHGATAEIEHGLAGVRIDVAAPPREHHAILADDQRVDDGARGVHGVNASVGEQHATGEAGTSRTAWCESCS